MPEQWPALERRRLPLSGMHRVGALSNYNACREGFIFSNGATLDLSEAAGFDAAMQSFFASALAIARAVLGAVERRVDAPAGWFEASFGPLADHAQWHIKRFVPERAPPHAQTTDGKRVLLPVHSDPSLVSVVVHDRPGTLTALPKAKYLVEADCAADFLRLCAAAGALLLLRLRRAEQWQPSLAGESSPSPP